MEVVKMVGEKSEMKFEETELRLGIGLSTTRRNNTNSNGKRGFVESSHDMDLKLNLVSNKGLANGHLDDEEGEDVAAKSIPKENNHLGGGSTDPLMKPPAKAQVVGWPPVRSYRKNILSVVHKRSGSGGHEDSSTGGATFVKVSLDGAPYLRKVDLNMYKSYQDLADALGNMFSSFTIGECGSQGLMDFMNEGKLMDLLNSSDYVPTYEDKDGDWMLVGDVPWEMFVCSCKRLRIMKGTEAIGLAPRAMAKCKGRS